MSHLPRQLLIYVSLGEEILPAETAPPMDRRLVEQALLLCGGPEAHVHFVHVIEVDPDDPALESKETRALLKQECERAQRIIATELVPLVGDVSKTNISVVAGSPSGEILRLARESQCELIAIVSILISPNQY